MTKEDKKELIKLIKEGESFDDIKGCVSCCDSTIKRYIKIFRPKKI